jgi:hypothetical protein
VYQFFSTSLPFFAAIYSLEKGDRSFSWKSHGPRPVQLVAVPAGRFGSGEQVLPHVLPCNPPIRASFSEILGKIRPFLPPQSPKAPKNTEFAAAGRASEHTSPAAAFRGDSETG